MKRGLKRKSSVVHSDDVEITLSDVEEDRNPVSVTVDKLSKDRRRILREEYVVQARTEPEVSTSVPEVDPTTYFIPDFASLDVEEFGSNKKTLKDSSRRKKRYISSVSGSASGCMQSAVH